MVIRSSSSPFPCFLLSVWYGLAGSMRRFGTLFSTPDMVTLPLVDQLLRQGRSKNRIGRCHSSEKHIVFAAGRPLAIANMTERSVNVWGS